MTCDTVTLSFSLAVSEPYNISISHPERADSLKLVATVKQESSPFPDRAVTLLTKYTILDTSGTDPFRRRIMSCPTDITDDQIKIHMHTIYGFACRAGRRRGARDMRQRKDHNLITVPPLGQGGVSVTWSLAPEYLLRFYKPEEASLEARLKRFTVGQQFKIKPAGIGRIWWTWGSLQHDLKDKKFSHWSLPENLSIIREAGQDEGDEVDSSLIDVVDHRDLGYVVRRWHLEGPIEPQGTRNEEPPKVKEMRTDGWVFGEPSSAIELICDQVATFGFVE